MSKIVKISGISAVALVSSIFSAQSFAAPYNYNHNVGGSSALAGGCPIKHQGGTDKFTFGCNVRHGSWKIPATTDYNNLYQFGITKDGWGWAKKLRGNGGNPIVQ